MSVRQIVRRIRSSHRRRSAYKTVSQPCRCTLRLIQMYNSHILCTYTSIDLTERTLTGLELCAHHQQDQAAAMHLHKAERAQQRTAISVFCLTSERHMLISVHIINDVCTVNAEKVADGAQQGNQNRMCAHARTVRTFVHVYHLPPPPLKCGRGRWEHSHMLCSNAFLVFDPYNTRTKANGRQRRWRRRRLARIFKCITNTIKIYDIQRSRFIYTYVHPHTCEPGQNLHLNTHSRQWTMKFVCRSGRVCSHDRIAGLPYV